MSILRVLWRNVPNTISTGRLLTAATLPSLALLHRIQLFQWLLLACLLSDILDGALARRFALTSPRGASLDSFADVLTTFSGITGILVFHKAFVAQHPVGILLVIAFYAAEVAASLWRYGRVSSFHTHLARLAAVMAGITAMSLFFTQYGVLLYRQTVIVYILSLTEELLLLVLLPRWQSDVKGLYWVVASHNLKQSKFPSRSRPELCEAPLAANAEGTLEIVLQLAHLNSTHAPL